MGGERRREGKGEKKKEPSWSREWKVLFFGLGPSPVPPLPPECGVCVVSGRTPPFQNNSPGFCWYSGWVIIQRTRPTRNRPISLPSTARVPSLAVVTIPGTAHPNYGTRPRGGIVCLSEQHGIPVWMLSTESGLLLNSGRKFSGDQTRPNPTFEDITYNTQLSVTEKE